VKNTERLCISLHIEGETNILDYFQEVRDSNITSAFVRQNSTIVILLEKELLHQSLDCQLDHSL
jgi:hypothetical protein